MVGEGLAGLRRTEVIDFAIGGTGGLAVVLAVQFAMGATSALLAIYPREGNPTFLPLNDVLCSHIAVDPASGVWCMGPSLTDHMLYRMTGPQSSPRFLLPRQSLRIPKGQGKESREPFENGPLGTPSMLTPAAGKLIAWFPNSRTVVFANTRSGIVQPREVDVDYTGRAAISVAGDSEGRILGLLPLRGKADPEEFSTNYALFQMDGADGWQRIPNLPEVGRGTIIAGVDGGSVVLWDRQQRTLRWINRPASKSTAR